MNSGLPAAVTSSASYDPDIPAHENEEYVRRTRKYLDRDAEVMKGNSKAFGTRLDRGWVPPTLDDLEAELEKDPEKT